MDDRPSPSPSAADDEEQEQTQSPAPAFSPAAPIQVFPTCSGCKEPVEKVRYLDYSDVRLVYHDVPQQCVLGVMSAI